jgi:hypothetical protein
MKHLNVIHTNSIIFPQLITQLIPQLMPQLMPQLIKEPPKIYIVDFKKLDELKKNKNVIKK